MTLRFMKLVQIGFEASQLPRQFRVCCFEFANDIDNTIHMKRLQPCIKLLIFRQLEKETFTGFFRFIAKTLHNEKKKNFFLMVENRQEILLQIGEFS